ncbi:helix-turn-helix domain-containing protein [Pseudanabaena sp. PCC 6802]|uniref:helix-turn-helix domain-containing protein n=1 Tax=Pseudanabaena sp. PCC 6802 TaxID=118173 RepID=UPI00034A197E|nr:helix-turn-helix domain-containing protein [Pseudanabaena sp. PCC 6802]
MTTSNKEMDLDSSSIEQGLFLTSFQRKLLLKNLQEDLRQEYQHRIQIMLFADRGESQAQIRKALGCAQETVRYWVAIARSGQAHRWSEFSVGRPKAINEEYCQRLQELVGHSPRNYGYAFQRWTAHWLSKHLAKELGITISDRHVNRLLKSMGLSTRMPAGTSETQANASDSANERVAIRDLPYSQPSQGSDRKLDISCSNEIDRELNEPDRSHVWEATHFRSAEMDWNHFNSNGVFAMSLGY